MWRSANKWGIEFVLLSLVQTLVFAGALGLTFLCLGVNYEYALIIGVPFFALLVLMNNMLVILVRPPWAKRTVTLVTVILHFVAWGEDLNNYFFVSALAGILIGGTLIIVRKWIIARLNLLWPQTIR